MTGQNLQPGASAEKRYRSLLDRRDFESGLSDEARAQRDMLQARRRELIDEARAARDRRNALSDEAKLHEERARRLAGTLPKTGGQRRGQKKEETPEEKLARMDGEIVQWLHDLETTPRPLAEEKALVQKIKRQKREADGLRATITPKAAAVLSQGADPTAPDDIRREIELARGKALELRQQAQTEHEAATKHSADIDNLAKEADTFHQRSVEHRTRAQEYHDKAQKMKELVIAERAKRQAEHAEAREAMDEQSDKVKRELYDETRIEKEEDEAVAALKARGRLSL